MDTALLTTLRAHNPWLEQPDEQRSQLSSLLPSPFVPRKRQLEIVPGRAELVVGPRQAGKSTWIRKVLSGRTEPLLLLAAEEPRVRELASSPALALDGLRDVLQPTTTLLIEEVQHLDEAALFIKGWVDLEPQRRIVVTGSSSFTLRARTRESLAGRARRTLLLPFSLEEVAATLPAGLVPAIREMRLAELWERLVVSGGYPDAWLAEDPRPTLHRLVEAFVLKDASDLHTIELPLVFRKLLGLAAADIGNLANISKWAAVAGASRNTVSRYLAIAEDAHIMRLLPPFAGGARGEVKGMAKVYFLDNGLRNTIFGGFEASDRRADRGALWENAVFCELMKRLDLLDEVFYWRSKSRAEVDFVVRRGQLLLAIEVRASELQRPTLSRAARSFIDAYSPACFGVVNASLRHDIEVDGVSVLFRRPWELDELLAGS